MKVAAACIVSVLFGLAGGHYLSTWDRTSILLEGGAVTDELSQKSIQRLHASGYLAGEGSISDVNQVHIECELTGNSCKMILAEIRHGNVTFLMLHESDFKIQSVDQNSLKAIDEAADSCLRTTLLIDRTSKSITLIKTNEASNECAQWTGYPKIWSLRTETAHTHNRL